MSELGDAYEAVTVGEEGTDWMACSGAVILEMKPGAVCVDGEAVVAGEAYGVSREGIRKLDVARL